MSSTQFDSLIATLPISDVYDANYAVVDEIVIHQANAQTRDAIVQRNSKQTTPAKLNAARRKAAAKSLSITKRNQPHR